MAVALAGVDGDDDDPEQGRAAQAARWPARDLGFDILVMATY